MDKEYNVRPLGSRVIIKMELKERVTESGIIIPASEAFLDEGGVMQKGHLPNGIIMVMGPECKQPINVGDLVSFETQMVKEIWHPDNESHKVQHYITNEVNLETIIS